MRSTLVVGQRFVIAIGICLFALLCAGLPGSVSKQDFSVENQKKLDLLLNYFISKTTFPYTLFCDKPVSWEVISLNSYRRCGGTKKVLPYLNKEASVLWECWEVMESLRQFYSNEKFVIIKEDNSELTERIDIFLINKNQFVKVVNDNIELFKFILKRQISGEALLIEVERTSSLRPLINNNHLLFGVLLGYGVNNSMLYQQRHELRILYNQLDNTLNKDSQTLYELREQIEQLNGKLTFSEGNENCLVKPVYFVADKKHPETQCLTEKYTLQQKELSKLLSQEDRCEIFIRELFGK